MEKNFAAKEKITNFAAANPKGVQKNKYKSIKTGKVYGN